MHFKLVIVIMYFLYECSSFSKKYKSEQHTTLIKFSHSILCNAFSELQYNPVYPSDWEDIFFICITRGGAGQIVEFWTWRTIAHIAIKNIISDDAKFQI